MNEENQLFGGITVDDAVAKLAVRKSNKPQKEHRGKFNISAKEDRTVNGKTYDSKLEMAMHQELLKHFPEEYIHCQVSFVLQPNYCLDSTKELQRALVYRADFVLGAVCKSADGSLAPTPGSMVLDAKGMVMQSFVTASKLFEYKHRMPVMAVKNVKQLKTIIEKHKIMQSINQELMNIILAGAPVWVEGYRDSEGNVSDLRVAIAGRQGYLKLVRDSIEMLPTAMNVLHKSGEIKDYDQDMITQTVAKVLASLTKKSEENPEEQGAARRSSNETFDIISPDVVMVNGDPEKIALLRVDVLEERVIEKAVVTKVSGKATILRALIESKLPIDRYKHRLNLYPGKFTTVTL